MAVVGRRAGPPFPLLRHVRDRWVDDALALLRDDPNVVGVGLVGSLGRNDHDDWSDVDIAIVVVCDPFEFLTPHWLHQASQVTMCFDARQNAPRGVAAVSGQVVGNGLPLWVDCYAYPASFAWPSDCRVLIDQTGFSVMQETFAEHLARREAQPGTPKTAADHRLMQLGLIPVAGKRIARRDPSVGSMVEFLGGTCCDRADNWEGHLLELRRVLGTYQQVGPAESVAAADRYLNFVESFVSSDS